jgi:hypothetical protein
MLLVLILIFAAFTATARASWEIEAMGGSAYNLPLPLSIHQHDEPNMDFLARYDERTFVSTPYYAWRTGWWFDNNQAIEFEQIHHKITLTNRGDAGPGNIEWFEISHGCNLMYFDWAINVCPALDAAGNPIWWHDFIVRLGAGPVITHPEGEVRHRRLPSGSGLLRMGYYLSGETVQVAVEKRFYLWKRLFLSLEVKNTDSYVTVPVWHGNADVPNAAWHGLLGVGYEFFRKDPKKSVVIQESTPARNPAPDSIAGFPPPETPPKPPVALLTARPEYGIGGAFNPRAHWGGAALEPYIMPTPDRGFIVSPLLTFGWGSSGTLSSYNFSQYAIAVGLGYQWYFGAEKATSLYLMAHFGGGQITRQKYLSGGFGYADATIGSLHRWKNGFLLGGALIADGLFGRHTQSSEIFGGSNAVGDLEMWRLGAVLGYAIK